MTKKDLSYHRDRSLQELHLGLTAPSIGAARSHLRLSTLHMEKVLEMSRSDVMPRPLFVLG